MNYKIEAIEILLSEECILNRYDPLIPYKTILLQNLLQKGYRTKNDCLLLSKNELIQMGLPSEELVQLFYLFLKMYDVKQNKLKEIEKIAINEEEKILLKELYLLPGVKAIRARLYIAANYTNLSMIASALPEQIIKDTSQVIIENNMDLKVPLLKEVKTHIVVAKLFTEYKVD